LSDEIIQIAASKKLTSPTAKFVNDKLNGKHSNAGTSSGLSRHMLSIGCKNRPHPKAGPEPDQAGGFQMMTFFVGSSPGALAILP
jgi:hypothetical protein